MTVTSPSTGSGIDARACAELWRRVQIRLTDGEPLATQGQFLAAIEAAYLEWKGKVPTPGVRRHLRHHVRQVNEERPEIYLALGVQNAVQQAFAHGVQSLHWEVARVEQYGAASIRTFLHQEQVADYLVAHRLDAAHIDVHACVRHGMSWAKSNPRPKIANRKRQPTKAMLLQDACPTGSRVVRYRPRISMRRSCCSPSKPDWRLLIRRLCLALRLGIAHVGALLGRSLLL